MVRKKKNIFEHLGSFVQDPLGMKEAEKKKKEQKKKKTGYIKKIKGGEN